MAIPHPLGPANAGRYPKTMAGNEGWMCRMNFFRALEAALTGNAAPPTQMPEHPCARCQVSMTYRGPHAFRTGGLSRGPGLGRASFLVPAMTIF